MEWVETTGKSIDEAKDLALDRLGVAADEAEFDVVEEPKSGLFGRVRGEARVRARVMPTAVRPKQERRPRGRNQKRDADTKASSDTSSDSSDESDTTDSDAPAKPKKVTKASKVSNASKDRTDRPQPAKQNREHNRMDDERQQSDVTPQEVGEAASAFMAQLADAFGYEDATSELTVDGTDLEVRLSGAELGLMVGPGGRTLTAIQDLVRVASQRRLGDHETRLRIDVGGYREKRRGALEKFAASVAAQVIETGEPKALEPMPSNDRKAIHDAIIEIDGVTSRSDGDDPRRRVVITPE
ncbi:MAG: RNA-binding cell elongation regulator Jag/EloR [Ilumatobacteraceae bacterium]